MTVGFQKTEMVGHIHNYIVICSPLCGLLQPTVTAYISQLLASAHLYTGYHYDISSYSVSAAAYDYILKQMANIERVSTVHVHRNRSRQA